MVGGDAAKLADFRSHSETVATMHAIGGEQVGWADVLAPKAASRRTRRKPAKSASCPSPSLRRRQAAKMAKTAAGERNVRESLSSPLALPRAVAARAPVECAAEEAVA